jgi:DNA-binding beta-propeller fold protein YncE
MHGRAKVVSPRALVFGRSGRSLAGAGSFVSSRVRPVLRTLCLFASGSTGCIREVGPGPDLGDCAQYPEGVYTYGQIGIGTCLSGPADLQFIERDGQTLLAVSNADPYGNFGEGSVTVVDWASIDLGKRENLMSEVDAWSLPLDPLAGGLGWVPDRDLLLVTSRYSEGGVGRENADPLIVVDLADPTVPEPWSSGASLTLEDDPQPIVVDAEAGFAYVLNMTDHSVSVVDLAATPLEIVDLHPDALYGDTKLIDADASGTTADAVITPIEGTLPSTDTWTLTFAEGSWRLWIASGAGLQRWTTGGLDYVPSGLGVELDPGDSAGEVEEVIDPYFFLESDVGSMLFADRGAIRVITLGELFDGGVPLGAWDWESQTSVLGGSDDGWDYWVEGPAPAEIDDVPTLYYTGRPDDDEDGAIGVARAVDGENYTREEDPVLEPPAGASWEQPFVLVDPFTASYRMWFSAFDGDRWSVAHSTSEDGLVWDEPEVVLTLDAADVGAPTVTYSLGRYQMWVAHRPDGDTTWSVAATESADGVAWAAPIVVLAGDPSLAPERPPRHALQSDPQNSWRIEGDNSGLLTVSATAAGEYLTEHGFSLHVAGGWEIDGGAVPGDVASASLVPDSWVTVDGVPTLYATATDAAGRTSLIALQQDARGRWVSVREDLVPAGTGGNTEGARAALVLPPDGLTGGDYVMLYAGVDNTGAALMRRATSSNGLDWDADDAALLPTEEYDAFAQLPHAAQILDDGALRIWYTADSGAVTRIAVVDTDDDGQTFTRTGGPDGWLIGTGVPGSFDDSGVSDPWPYVEDGVEHVLFTASDGDALRIGHAVFDGTDWLRDIDPWTELAEPAMVGVDTTFSELGVSSLVGLDGPEATEFMYAGFDGFARRVGRAVRHGSALFPVQNVPTTGDQLVFTTQYGGAEAKVIELGQTVDGFSTTGIGATAMRLDPERGFLYVTSKLADHVFVIDVRDDSAPGFVDANYRDIEAVLLVTSLTGSIGFRDVYARPGTNLLYAAGRLPDALVVLDIAGVVDDDRKDAYLTTPVGTIPVRGSDNEDEGFESLAEIGIGMMAGSQDGRYLYATHYNENSLYVFDLELGAWGEEITYVPYLGENPYTLRLDPTGRYAVVANYTGEVVDHTVHSSLAVVDVDPTSPTFLSVLTWLVNR